MPLDLARIQVVCFDVDGTLSDTDNQWICRIERAFQPLRRLFPQQQVHSFARRLVMEMDTPGNMIYELLDRLHLDETAARLIAALTIPKKDKEDHFLLVPGVDKMLVELQVRYPLAVVTARGERSTMAFLNQHRLLPFFSVVSSAHSCIHTKPFPDPILWAAEHMGVSPEACLMVGDTTVDVHSGKAAGAQTVAVLCGFGTRRELIRAGADLILDSTADLEVALIE